MGRDGFPGSLCNCFCIDIFHFHKQILSDLEDLEDFLREDPGGFSLSSLYQSSQQSVSGSKVGLRPGMEEDETSQLALGFTVGVGLRLGLRVCA